MKSIWKANPLSGGDDDATVSESDVDASTSIRPSIVGEDSVYSWVVVVAAFITGFVSRGYFFSFGISPTFRLLIF